jgi:hypothetical protein
MQTAFLSDPRSFPRKVITSKPVCDLTHAVEIQGTQACKMHIKSAPAAKTRSNPCSAAEAVQIKKKPRLTKDAT